MVHDFNKDPYSILMEIKDKFEFEAPQLLRGPLKLRNKDKYCRYHKDLGHDTNECNNLKRLLDKLAQKGMLDSYITRQKYKFAKREEARHKEAEEVVAVISGGFASGGPTVKGTKDHLRSLSQVMVSDKP